MSLLILIEILKHWKFLNLKRLGAVILTKNRLQSVKLPTKALPTLTEHCKRQNVRFHVKCIWCLYGVYMVFIWYLYGVYMVFIFSYLQ